MIKQKTVVSDIGHYCSVLCTLAYSFVCRLVVVNLFDVYFGF